MMSSSVPGCRQTHRNTTAAREVQTHLCSSREDVAPTSRVPLSLTDSEKVNFSPAPHDVNAGFIWPN